MKISKTQLEHLKKLKKGNFEFHPYRGKGTHNRYTIKKTYGKVRLDSVKKLIILGFAERTKIEHSATVGNRHEVRITKKGIKFLEGENENKGNF